MNHRDLLEKTRAKSTVKPYTGISVEIEKPEELPILAAPSVINTYNEQNVTLIQRSADQRICQGETLRPLYPMSACWKDNNWISRMNVPSKAGAVKANQSIGTPDLLEEVGYFREKPDGVYALKEYQESFLITNIRLRVKARIKKYVDDKAEPQEELKCLLYSEKWDTPETVIVPLSEYKNVYLSTIKSRFPALFLSSKGRDYLEKYLASVYDYCQDNMVEEVRIMKTGWTTLGGTLRFVIGEDPIYRGFELPDVSLMDKASVFTEGFRFLKIGRLGSVSLVPFIFAHFSYAAFFINKARREFQSVLFIRGETNTYKTRIAKLFCNVFQTDSAKKMISFGSTRPAFYKFLSELRDQTILLDDYSCSEQRKKRDDTALLEAAIRSIGDSTPPIKMSASQEDGIDSRSFRSTLVVTGEDNPPLSNSSYYRMIIVPVDKHSYDNEVLDEFEHNPSIMRNYMGLFIEFLRVHGEQIAEGTIQKAREYNDRYGQNFKVDRVRYAAVNLMVVGDMIRQYAYWCGITNPDILDYIAQFDRIIVEAMLENQEENSVLAPEVMFLYALRQALGTRDNIKLAESEVIYISNESGYIGFQEKRTDTIWLRHEDAEQIVRSYWERQGKAYTASLSKLKKILYEKEFSLGRESAEGKTEYLLRAKKGSRKRMLVLRYQKVCQILESIKD